MASWLPSPIMPLSMTLKRMFIVLCVGKPSFAPCVVESYLDIPYLFLNGDKSSENWVLCNIFRIRGAISSAALGQRPVIASFKPGELLPHDWDSIQFDAAAPYGDASFQSGTYTGTVYYTIGLE